MMKYLIFFVLFAAVQSYVHRNSFSRQLVNNVIRYAPAKAGLFQYSGPLTGREIENRLISNYTVIRQNVVGGFTCQDKVYGYYADVNNDCQIFHVCVPLMQLFPDHYGPNAIQDFSFICGDGTVFSQDSMVCDYERSAVECKYAPELYHLNNNFFVIDVPKLDMEDEVAE